MCKTEEKPKEEPTPPVARILKDSVEVAESDAHETK